MKFNMMNHRIINRQFFFLLSFCCCWYLCSVLVPLVESKTSLAGAACEKHKYPVNVSIGVIIDEGFRVGKEQRIAMELAAKDFRRCVNLVLHFRNSHGSSARATYAAINLTSHDQVQAILGSITPQDAALVSEFETVAGTTPVISLSPMGPDPQEVAPELLHFIRMATSITYQMQCIAAIVGHFRWKKVILIHEQANNLPEDFGLITHLSDSLQAVDSSIDHHLRFPRITSLLDPKEFIEEELRKVKKNNVKIFVVAQSSLEFSMMLFEKAKKLGMTEKGYVWIISDEIADLLDSVDFPILRNMQGVVGLKTNYLDTDEHFREFKSKFRRKYLSKYFLEEENSTPSIYSLRAYDAIWTIVKALQKSRRKTNSTLPLDHILSSDFEGLSGKISFKNSLLSQKPIFRIVNVIGKSYREIGFWSPDLGFSKDLNEPDGERTSLGSDLTSELNSIYWPGSNQSVPKGLILGNSDKPLRIGVPVHCMFKRFVNVTYDPTKNQTLVAGFSIQVFEAAIKQLPYDIQYEFVPHFGSYDEIVARVHDKSLDAAVGDIVVTADRYVYAEFSQPYIESGLAMVVTVRPTFQESKFIVLNAFTKKMWIQLVGMSISTGAIIWLSEYSVGNEQFRKSISLELIGSILWLSVTILSFSHREHIKSYASKIVLGAWIAVVFVVGASFTAVLSSMMTVPRLQPSVPDVDYLRNTNAAVGCDGNSFVCQYLINVLHFKPGNVKRFYSIDDYPKAFESGEIKAAFFSAAHARVFIAVYCKGYTISGPNFKIGGLGFVFQKGSSLAIDMSEAILKITQSGQLNTLEKNILSFSNCSSSTAESGDIKLSEEPFSGLFLVLGVIIGATFFIAILRLQWTNIYELVQRTLVIHRIGVWASIVLTECYTRFGFSFLVPKIITMNDPHCEMEPHFVEIQLADNQM